MPTRMQTRTLITANGHGPLPIITAVCKHDQLLHVCNALHFVTLV